MVLASAPAAPTIGHCKELNKLCRQIRNDEVETRVWPVKGSPRIIGIPDAAFRNNSDKSCQRAMTVFIADERVKGGRDTRGSLMFFESTKIKRTTLSTTVAELYALMKCFGTCQMLRGLWKDISGMDAEIHIRTDANNLVTTASTTHAPEQQETIHMIQMLRKEPCSGAIADLSHVRTEHCLSDSLTKKSANPENLLDAVRSGWLKELDAHPPFRSMSEHKAFLNAWLQKELSGYAYVLCPCFCRLAFERAGGMLEYVPGILEQSCESLSFCNRWRMIHLLACLIVFEPFETLFKLVPAYCKRLYTQVTLCSSPL